MATKQLAAASDAGAPGDMRIGQLDSLIAAFEAFGEDSPRQQFTTLFAEGALVLELTDSQLSMKLRISRPTAGRWMRGESAPHSLGRKAVIDVLIREAKDKKRTIVNRQSVLPVPELADC